jgi:hypothetical protein
MNLGPELLLVASVAVVGVLHTIVPDHWVPITLIARQRKWSKSETARASLQAGAGRVLSTLIIALVIWLAGVAFAERFRHTVVAERTSQAVLSAHGDAVAWPVNLPSHRPRARSASTFRTLAGQTARTRPTYHQLDLRLRGSTVFRSWAWQGFRSPSC